MARETQNDRLDRIENKLDKLSEAIVSLARAEEKISQMEKFLHQQMEMLVDGQRRLEAVEKNVMSNATTINVINKLFWIVMAAAATTITGMLLMQ
jgi:ribosome-binding ATPase YchF (GTP1/OBG family)|tara:strand:- start:290 stop:574 length:285 start_codon:yes stop_codon:yes gene_type:complete